MFNFLKNIFRTPIDENVVRIKKIFSFLLNDYGFTFAKNNLGNLVDENGKLIFYGPVYSYHLYNDNVCINILYVVQREDYIIYITDVYKNDQVYIRNGIMVPLRLAYDLPTFAEQIKISIETDGKIYDRNINDN